MSVKSLELGFALFPPYLRRHHRMMAHAVQCDFKIQSWCRQFCASFFFGESVDKLPEGTVIQLSACIVANGVTDVLA
jgi:hypothetical protein